MDIGALRLALFDRACEAGWHETIARLGPHLDVEWEELANPLAVHAAREGHLDVLRMLVAGGHALDGPEAEQCPFYAAAQAGRLEVTGYLLETGASTDYAVEDLIVERRYELAAAILRQGRVALDVHYLVEVLNMRIDALRRHPALGPFFGG